MSIFQCYYAKPGNYKSLYFAILVNTIFQRNKNWYDKQIEQYWIDLDQYQKRCHTIDNLAYLSDTTPQYGQIPQLPLKRQIATNIRLSQKQIDLMGDYLYYWTDLEQIVNMKDCDLVIDEIAEFMDSREFELMSRSVKRFLSQYRRLGIYIYGNTQHWSMIDKRARLMFTHVFKMVKIAGNPDPSPTRPKIKTIWGLGFIFPVTNFESEDDTKMSISLMGSDWFFVNRGHVEMYDTREIIANREYPPLKHIVQKCEYHGIEGHDCSFTKTIHK